MSRLLVLRPEPGASATCRRAAARGLVAVAAPLFVVRPVEWGAPAVAVDAILMTSANAARHGGPGLGALTHLPVFAAGDATAAAAREAGFGNVASARGDGAAALALLEAAGHARALHLAGLDHAPLAGAGAAIDRRVVYAADEIDRLPVAARDAIFAGAVALLHSPRAAALFRRLLLDAEVIPLDGVAIATLSSAVAAAAGPGWSSVAIAATPDDAALLAAAALLCDTSATP